MEIIYSQHENRKNKKSKDTVQSSHSEGNVSIPVVHIIDPQLAYLAGKIQEKKLDIENDLFDKFLYGETTYKENELILKQLHQYPDLMEAFNIIVSTAKLVGKEPICSPDLELAEQQISSHLQEVSKNHTK